MLYNYKKRGLIVLFLIIVLTFLINVNALNIEISETTYLAGENVYFKVCSESINRTTNESNVNVSVTCILPDKLKNYFWSSQCDLYAFNSFDATCSNPVIIARENNLMRDRIININDYGKVLRQKIDEKVRIDDISSIGIAELIYGYSLLNKQTEITDLLEILKERRNNLNKCWPENKCDIEQTVDILFYLSLAGLNSSYRTYLDAMFWLETQQYILDEQIEITVFANDGTKCKVFEENQDIFADQEKRTEIFNFEVKSQDRYRYKYSYNSGQKLNFTCDNDFYIEIIDSYDILLFSESKRGSSDFEEGLIFEMTLGCWGRTGSSFNECSIALTSKISLLRDLNPKVLEQSEYWLYSQIRDQKMEAKRVKSTRDILVNLMNYAILGDDLIKNYILYSQNNDGSFGEGDEKPLMTLYAIKYFDKADIEWVNDAKRWITNYRRTNGLKTIVENALMFELFETKRPFLRTDPLILKEDSGKISFDLIASENVSNVTFQILSNFSDKIKLEAEESFINTEVILNVSLNEVGIHNGHLEAKSNSFNYKFPFVIYNEPSLEFNFNDKIVYEKIGHLEFLKSSNSDVFDCEFNFDVYYISSSTFEITPNSVKFAYNLSDKHEDFSKEVSVNYSCTTNYGIIKNQDSFNLEYYLNYPFDYELLNGIISSRAGRLKLSNNLDYPLEINLAWGEMGYLYQVQPEIILEARETKVLYLCQTEEYEETIELTDVLRLSALGYKTEIPFEIILGDKMPTKCGTFPYRNNTWIIVLSIFLILLALVGLYLTKKNKSKKNNAKEKDDKEERNDKEKKDENEDDEVKEIPKKPKVTHVRSTPLAEVLVALDQSLGESTSDIKKELKKEGYKKKEVEKTFTTLADIKEHLENIEKQKKIDEAEENSDKTNEDSKDKDSKDKK